MQSVLRVNSPVPVRVFVVWLPVLFTDFTPPNTSAMARVPDPRARQFWDPDRMIAKAIDTAGAGQPEPDCCELYGLPWDVAAVYPPGVRWDERLPPANFLNGPVADLTDAIDAALKGTGTQPKS